MKSNRNEVEREVPPELTKAKVRFGYSVALVFFAILGTTLLLNKTLSQNVKQLRIAEATTESLGKQCERIKMFAYNKEEFYIEMVRQFSIFGGYFGLGLKNKDKYDSVVSTIGKRIFSMSRGSKPVAADALLRVIVSSGLNSSDVAAWVEAGFLRDFERITSAKLPQIIGWVDDGYMFISGAGRPVTFYPGTSEYFRRDIFDYAISQPDDFFYWTGKSAWSDRLQRFKTIDEAVGWVCEEWEKSVAIGKGLKYKQPALSAAAIGLNLDADEVLIAGSLLLISLQALFFVFWRREKQLAAIRHSQPSFTFPDFHSPMDPLYSGGPIEVSDFIQRLVWISFLIAPILVFTVAYLFRFEFMSYSLYATAKNSFVFRYRPFSLSLFFDYLALLYLSISIAIALCTTSVSNYQPRHGIRLPQPKHLPLLAPVLASLIVVAVILRLRVTETLPSLSISSGHENPFQTLLAGFHWVVYVLIWTVAGFIAYFRRSQLVLCLAFVAISLLLVA